MKFSLPPFALTLALVITTTTIIPQSSAHPVVNGNGGGGAPPGAVHVINHCPFEVHSDIVHPPREGLVGAPQQIKSVMAPGRGHEGGTWPGSSKASENRLGHQYTHDPNIGVSWKLYHPNNTGPIQFEWTWVPEQKRVYWDISMIDAQTSARHPHTRTVPSTADSPKHNITLPGHAPTNVTYAPSNHTGESRHSFHPHGITVTPVLNGDPVKGPGMGSCAPVRCLANQGLCVAAYNSWNDWTSAQKDCPQAVSLRVELCA